MIVDELIGKYVITKNEKQYEFFISEEAAGNTHIRILKYLSGIENGFFVEAGACKGENSTILKELGWNGMLIEPSDSLYQWCLKNRSESIVENYALVSADFKKDEISGNHQYQGIKIKQSDIIIMDDSDTVKYYKNKMYPVSTFDKLAKKHNIKKIDVFFLDVEGYEMEVVKGIDFESVDITYMVIEVNNNFYSLDDMNKFMGDKGYENILNISNFNSNNSPDWPGTHQDYLYKKIE